jgi:hypothetical protein
MPFSGVGTVQTGERMVNLHSWESALRNLTPASAFRHPKIQSGTGPKNTGLRRISPVPYQFRHCKFFPFRFQSHRIPESPAFRHFKSLAVCPCPCPCPCQCPCPCPRPCSHVPVHDHDNDLFMFMFMLMGTVRVRNTELFICFLMFTNRMPECRKR